MELNIPAGLSTLSRYITLVIPALVSHLKSGAHALNKAQWKLNYDSVFCFVAKIFLMKLSTSCPS